MFYFIISRLDMPPNITVIFGIVFTLLVGLGVALFATVRCVLVLLIPQTFTSVGQICFGAIVIALVISGPVYGLMDSSKEVGRSIYCNTMLIVNQTQASLQLRFLPMIDVLINIVNQADRVRSLAANVTYAFFPMLRELNTGEDTREEEKTYYGLTAKQIKQATFQKIIESKKAKVGQVSHAGERLEQYVRNMSALCKQMIAKAVDHCKKEFENVYNRCTNAIKFLPTVFCALMKMSVICEAITWLESFTNLKCSRLEFYDAKIGTTVDMAERLTKSLDAQFEANIQYLASDEIYSDDSYMWMVDDARSILEGQLGIREKIVNFILACIDRFIVLLFLIVLYTANYYHNLYLNEITFDNNHVNEYFKHIDRRRRLAGKNTLLPLKKLEEKDIVLLSEGKMNVFETKKVISGTFSFITRFSLCAVIVALDWFFYELLSLLRRHGKIEFRQEGRHHISFAVEGNGILAVIVKTLLGSFSFTHELKNITSNEKCLPNPFRTPMRSLIFLLLALIASWWLIILQAYMLRTRQSIAGFFYRKRAKQRTLHLYNEMLRRRAGFLRHVRRRIRKKVKDKTLMIQVSFLTALRNLCPCCFQWIYRKFGLGKNRCLICDDWEDDDFVYCLTPGCFGVYCPQCWSDIDMKCYACRPTDEWSVSSS